jgi:carbon-monoxide dehydrogenase medium subunit
VKPAPFEYVRPDSLDEAIAFLGDGDRFAKVLAGGQSLVPMMNFRLARPELLVDLRCVPGLSGIRIEGDLVVIGAMTTQQELEGANQVYEACPLFRTALRHVGHQQTRSRGTVGGSVAHADPAAELPAVALALDAEFVAHGAQGTRRIKATDFFRGPYTSVLADDEILTELSFATRPGTRTGFIEFTRRAGDFALGGAVVALQMGDDGETVEDARIAAFGVGGTPSRLEGAENLVRAKALTEKLAEEAGRSASGEVTPIASHGVNEHYRRRLIGTLVKRALKEMIE